MLNKSKANKSKSYDYNKLSNIASVTKSNCSLKPELIFNAIEKNYIGVVKIYLKIFSDLIKIKNSDNRTPLYFAIHLMNHFFVEIIFASVFFNLSSTSFKLSLNVTLSNS